MAPTPKSAQQAKTHGHSAENAGKTHFGAIWGCSERLGASKNEGGSEHPKMCPFWEVGGADHFGATKEGIPFPTPAKNGVLAV